MRTYGVVLFSILSILVLAPTQVLGGPNDLNCDPTGCTVGFANTANGVDEGVIDTLQLVDGAVTAAKMATNGCSQDQLLKFNGASWVCSVIGSASLETQQLEQGILQAGR